MYTNYFYFFSVYNSLLHFAQCFPAIFEFETGTVMRYGEAKHSGIQATNLDVVYSELLHRIGTTHSMLLVPMISTVQSFLSSLFDRIITSSSYTINITTTEGNESSNDIYSNQIKHIRKMFLAFSSLLTISTSFSDFIFLYLRKLMASSSTTIKKLALSMLCDVFGW